MVIHCDACTCKFYQDNICKAESITMENVEFKYPNYLDIEEKYCYNDQMFCGSYTSIYDEEVMR